MIRTLSTPPANWNGRYPAPPPGAIGVNRVDDNGPKLAAYWDDGDQRAMTDQQWATYVTSASFTPPSEETNEQAIRDALRAAIVANRTFLAQAKPATAAAQASSAYDQAKALSRQQNLLIRLALNDLSGTD